MTVRALCMNYTNIDQVLEASKYVLSHPPPEQRQGGQVLLQPLPGLLASEYIEVQSYCLNSFGEIWFV